MEALDGWDKDRLNDREVESLFDGLRWMASRSPG